MDYLKKGLIEKIDKAGDFVTGDDGFVCYWPIDGKGAYTAYNLRMIADELDRRNKPWQDNIDKYFEKNPVL